MTRFFSWNLKNPIVKSKSKWHAKNTVLAISDISFHSQLVQFYCPQKEIPSVGPHLHQHKSNYSEAQADCTFTPWMLAMLVLMVWTLIHHRIVFPFSIWIGPSTRPPENHGPCFQGGVEVPVAHTGPWYLFSIPFRSSKNFTVEPVDFQDPLVALHEILLEISGWLRVGVLINKNQKAMQLWIDIFQSLYDYNTHLLPLAWSQLIFEQDMTNLKLLTRFQPTFHRVHCCTTNLSSPLKPKTLLVGRGRDLQHAVSHTQPCPAAPKATQCHFGEGLANWIDGTFLDGKKIKALEGGFLEYTFEQLFCYSGPSWVHSHWNLGRCCWSLLVVAVKFRNCNWRKNLFTPMKFWLPFHLIQNGTHFKSDPFIPQFLSLRQRPRAPL